MWQDGHSHVRWVTRTARMRSPNIWRMEKLEKERGETGRLIYGDCVINEHEPESWSWLARQSRSPQIKLWLSPSAGPPSLCFLCRAGLNMSGKTRPALAGSVWGISSLGWTVLLESWSSDIYYWSN